jgi:phage terminase small subunit
MTSKKRVAGMRKPTGDAKPGTPDENTRSTSQSASQPHSGQGGSATDPLPPAQELQPLPSFRPSNGLLTPFERRFCQEFLLDLVGYKAYQRARSPNLVNDDSARANASKLLATTNIQDEVQRLMDERARRTGITVDRVLLHAWDVAMADARELTELRIGCCRFCWGLYNQYQYTDAELELARDKHIREEAKRKKAEKDDFKPSEFHEKGGPGYSAARPPNPDCMECSGDGISRPVIHDTRELSPGAAALFDGIVVKRGKEGMTVNVKTQDRGSYLTLVARHLGMLNDKLMKPEELDNPLMALLKQIQSSHGSTVPVVSADPDRRGFSPASDVSDVTAKAEPKKWSRAK